MPEMTTFAGEPLAVEFDLNGSWCPAVLLGWRHEPDGTARVRIQFVIGGLRRASWLPLTDVRLPQPAPAWTPPAPRTEPDMLLPTPEQVRRTPTPLPPLPPLRSVQPVHSRS
ncbi:hypothetical protein [Modestobacter italicus]|uniref:hypothetical protein n=1 Tax=Modestobacter italicus (strain DSM 44449 / CECT 9708 / BC 501) TaxID=2732864 RepID=UPI001C95610A|nr:hypothetical protein [Modestobacter italicus]